jgi:phosphohistidine swiveling domain-containing protein
VSAGTTTARVLPAAAATEIDQVGAKFSRQATMRAAGLPVPPFFCLPADAFAAALAPVRDRVGALVAQLPRDDPEAVRRISARLVDLVRQVGVPSDLAAPVRAAAVDLAAGGLLSVRSSAVGAGPGGAGGEDTAGDAMAGISTSLLYVPPDDVVPAVLTVWASAFSPESLLYRLALGVDPAATRMAVGVQRMVEGTRSFVLFTRDPVTGSSESVVAAGHGIGEGVVAERVAVDHYFVRPSGVRSQPAHKATALTGAPGGGVVETPVPAHLRDVPVLTGEELQRLRALGQRLEALLGGPQDVEGTFDAAGRLHLLQARPIVMDTGLRQIWTSTNVTESFPGVTTTLTHSFARRFYASIFRDLYRRLGVPPDTLRRNEKHLQRMIGAVDGRIHYCLLPWYHLHRQLALFPLFRESWQQMMGLDELGPDERPDRLRDLARTRIGVAAALAVPVGRLVDGLVRHRGRTARFERWWSDAAHRHRSPGGAADAAADRLARVRAFEDLWAEVDGWWGITLVNDALLGAASRLASGLVTGALPDRDPVRAARILNGLLCGDEDNTSVRAVLSLVRLAETVAADPALDGQVRTLAPAEVWRRLQAGDLGDHVRAAVHRHLRDFGDRSPQELKLEQPGLRREPARLMAMIADQLRTGRTAAELVTTEARVRADAERELAEVLAPRSPRARVLRAVLARLREYLRFRENSRYARAELFGIVRDLCDSIGADLAATGVLDDARDVHHLTLAEVLGFTDGTGTSGDLRELAAVRRRADRHHRSLPDPPTTFSTLGAVDGNWPAAGGTDLGDGAVLTGLGSSSGRVRGVARVVSDPQAPPAEVADAILVARETDPGWLFLMLRARGIVVERGSMLSHTAITGRKFGIPTVVAVAGATRLIPDGALVEIDGGTGRVTVLDGDGDGDRDPDAAGVAR